MVPPAAAEEAALIVTTSVVGSGQSPMVRGRRRVRRRDPTVTQPLQWRSHPVRAPRAGSGRRR
ncbi:protein of unknown function [Blastococcus saxobsidens DD2]|uniref:Uncharacterized protein n=1 Tax=Blastococcus saxobsidens (strain DD2) TaxID=1146883 RepID=H6RSC9_BLASD|nr:protein of unknown function [Blastococcus saxobsidens DD2]